jgi:tetratricopeptide (TPR) repeat protein
MESLDHIRRLTYLGHFKDALRALDETSPSAVNRLEAQTLRAVLLEQVGQSDQAVAVATSIVNSKQLTASQRSECEAVVGRVLWDRGVFNDGLAHLHRAALFAEQASDLRALFSAKLKLLRIHSDRDGPAAASSVIADVRRIATRVGDPEVTARLHLYIAETEAKRGLLENSKRHISIAQRILKGAPNAYLEAFAGNLELAIGVLRAEFSLAMECGLRAMEMAKQSGSAKLQQSILGNLGNLFFEMGDFDRATNSFESSLAAPSTNGSNLLGLIHCLARAYLLQGRYDLCRDALDRIESYGRDDHDRLSYEHRHSAHTEVSLMASQGHFQAALSKIETVLELAQRAGDGLLQKQVELTRADLFQKIGRIPASLTLISEIIPRLVGASPDLTGYSEQILACALASLGDPSAKAHHDRAMRIYQGIGSVPRQMELAVAWKSALAVGATGTAGLEVRGEAPEVPFVRSVLHSVAMAFSQATRPEIVARELLEVIEAADCAHSARITVQGVNDITSINAPAGNRDVAETRLSVGFHNDREIQLRIRPKADVESVASLNALSLVLASLHEVQRARAEREERATLWPIEDLPENGRSMISGKMAELMTFARKIARTKVNVLITGESGTGKEILARAIHDFSDRAGKPFVPFNCTAIPRDLLESQLFGHRRGGGPGRGGG